jgi:hypothetical protein
MWSKAPGSFFTWYLRKEIWKRFCFIIIKPCSVGSTKALYILTECRVCWLRAFGTTGLKSAHGVAVAHVKRFECVCNLAGRQFKVVVRFSGVVILNPGFSIGFGVESSGRGSYG